MNVLFLSPFFPPNAGRYCQALARRGVRVLAVGDQPLEAAPAGYSSALADYVFEPNMSDYSALRAATRKLVSRHGAIHRLDSNGEHWLEFEGRLRDDFAHAGRRTHRNYRWSAAELERKLGSALFAVEPVPAAFAVTMGNVAYLLRQPELSSLRAAVALVQAAGS